MQNISPPLKRLQYLDIFRGFTVAFMIIVNSPGNQTAYAPLEHATWNGCTLADLVFPFFLFIVGVSIAVTYNPSHTLATTVLHITRRSIYLFFWGVFLNAFPHHLLDWGNLRILGVLQRIALCYFFAALLFNTTQITTQALLFVIILLSYWFLMELYPLTAHDNLAAMIDRAILLPKHLYTPLYDPEGLLSTLPSIATTLLGNLAGVWLLSGYTHLQKMLGLLSAAAIALVLALCIHPYFPMNKTLWTSSYVLWSGGCALCVLAFFFQYAEKKIGSTLFKPFELFGQHALLAYVLHIFFLKIQAIISLPHMNGCPGHLRYFLSEHLFGWTSLQNASLLYAISYLLLWWFILSKLYPSTKK